jgi:hypothetical protein
MTTALGWFESESGSGSYVTGAKQKSFTIWVWIIGSDWCWYLCNLARFGYIPRQITGKDSCHIESRSTGEWRRRTLPMLHDYVLSWIWSSTFEPVLQRSTQWPHREVSKKVELRCRNSWRPVSDLTCQKEITDKCQSKRNRNYACSGHCSASEDR